MLELRTLRVALQKDSLILSNSTGCEEDNLKFNETRRAVVCQSARELQNKNKQQISRTYEALDGSLMATQTHRINREEPDEVTSDTEYHFPPLTSALYPQPPPEGRS